MTTFYHYDDILSTMPAAAFVYYGNIKSIKDATEAQRCMTVAYDPKSGNVAAVCVCARACVCVCGRACVNMSVCVHVYSVGTSPIYPAVDTPESLSGHDI